MGKCYVHIIMGPAGSGKSTYCSTLQTHCATLTGPRRRRVYVANLDPAAEDPLPYATPPPTSPEDNNYVENNVAFDIRDLISVDDVTAELNLGPNGSLIYCMEYLLNHIEWLTNELDVFDDDDVVLLDCPGQVELYTHSPVMRSIVHLLCNNGGEGGGGGRDSKIAAVFVMDAATFLPDISKFISGSLLSLTAMVSLGLPHINVLSKCDIADKKRVEEILDAEGSNSAMSLLENENGSSNQNGGRKIDKLTMALCELIDDYSMVSFVPLDITDDDSIDLVLLHVDHCLQYGEDLEIRGADRED